MPYSLVVAVYTAFRQLDCLADSARIKIVHHIFPANLNHWSPSNKDSSAREVLQSESQFDVAMRLFIQFAGNISVANFLGILWFNGDDNSMQQDYKHESVSSIELLSILVAIKVELLQHAQERDCYFVNQNKSWPVSVIRAYPTKSTHPYKLKYYTENRVLAAGSGESILYWTRCETFRLELHHHIFPSCINMKKNGAEAPWKLSRWTNGSLLAGNLAAFFMHSSLFASEIKSSSISGHQPQQEVGSEEKHTPEWFHLHEEQFCEDFMLFKRVYEEIDQCLYGDSSPNPDIVLCTQEDILDGNPEYHSEQTGITNTRLYLFTEEIKDNPKVKWDNLVQGVQLSSLFLLLLTKKINYKRENSLFLAIPPLFFYNLTLIFRKIYLLVLKLPFYNFSKKFFLKEKRSSLRSMLSYS